MQVEHPWIFYPVVLLGLYSFIVAVHYSIGTRAYGS